MKKDFFSNAEHTALQENEVESPIPISGDDRSELLQGSSSRARSGCGNPEENYIRDGFEIEVLIPPATTQDAMEFWRRFKANHITKYTFQKTP